MSEEGGKAPPGQSDTVPPPPDPASGHHLQSQSGNLEIQSGKPQAQSATYQPHSASTLDSQSTLTGAARHICQAYWRSSSGTRSCVQKKWRDALRY